VPLIRGRVQDQAGPVADAAVSFAMGPVDLPDIAALTGPDGTFALTAPAPGAYEVVANFADGFSLRSTVDLPVGVQEVEITLTR
jgi:Carboxypeptidase regulatory-like domain